jgi:DNA-binding Xre family transcriptional regulator
MGRRRQVSNGPVRNRFKILLAEKEHAEGRTIRYDEIARTTGVHEVTLSRWATNTVTRYDSTTIAALCDYFGVTAGELIEYPLDIGQEGYVAAC